MFQHHLCLVLHRYTFYLDYLAAEYADKSQNALLHLREQSEYVRVLGSYPTGSVLVGPVLDAVRTLDAAAGTYKQVRRTTSYSKCIT